ncbi:D-2-hydroxyacid dehydrogenase family protein [Vibrio sp. T187]|uniref:D-2-hydroxyacid dehydrogenase family protein n=1 Tax=Vibrio TaxID=662 RepID=UPI0010C9BEFE|nr:MULTISPECIES: D-2-hydroxyacid dehydrogenase family protein [Vibrio]MBW3695181.1 D-2-hydroxyacid dehydrogenase family protein [Vibrio sp. T187]
MKIAILDDYQSAVKTLDCFALLEGHQVDVFTDTELCTETLAEKLQPYEVLVLIRERTQITEALLAKLPNLKLISQTGKVSNHIDVDVCKQYGVSVAEGIGSPVAPAELCWGLIMAASRHIPEYINNMSSGEWQQSGSLGLGRTLSGLTLGILGYGKIGKKIAQYAKAFDMNVMVWGSESSRAAAVNDGFQAAISQRAFFQSLDVLSLHLRLNQATKGIVTREDLALMKSNSLLVNTSRAELIEEGALLAELTRHPTKRAALDVFTTEPATPENEPLIALSNALCAPHLGYVEQGSYELYFKVAFENVVAYVNGQPQNLA